MKEFIEIMKYDPDRAYEFICNNYYKMSKDELKDIAKELLYAIYDNTDIREHNRILKATAEELEEMYEE